MTIKKNVTWFNLELSYWVQYFDNMSLDQRINVHKRFARNFPGGGGVLIIFAVRINMHKRIARGG